MSASRYSDDEACLKTLNSDPVIHTSPVTTDDRSNDATITTNAAPIEVESPLGRSVGPVTVVLLNASNIIGVGIFSTSSAILRGTGSVGTSMLFWVFGILVAASHLSVLLEFMCYFPARSGSFVVFLEQAFPRPRHLLPTVVALAGVLFSFASSSALVLAKYIFQAVGHEGPSSWELKGLAVASYTAILVILAFSNKISYCLVNAIGVVKILTLVFISVAGHVVLGGHDAARVPDPGANFRDAFVGTTTAYGLSNALVKIIFSYSGSGTSVNVANEVCNPGKSLRRMEFLALGVTGVLFVATNLAFFIAIPKDDLAGSTEIAASLFFRNVFGDSGWTRALNVLIAVSTLGSIVSTTLGSSRLTRESGRQGVLPFPAFWASTRPFGTPMGPYLSRWVMTTLMVLAPPAGDAFNFIVDLQMYSISVFEFVLTVGLILVRIRMKRVGAPAPVFRAWNIAVALNLLAAMVLLVMPWYPPDGGQYAGVVSFFYATAPAVSLGILALCGLYYVGWRFVLPWFGGYEIRCELAALDGGAQTNRFVKVPKDKVSAWDAARLSTEETKGSSSNSVSGSTASERQGSF